MGKISHVAQVGISVEPLLAVEQQAAALTTQTTNNFIEFAQKTLSNFVNYVSSFSVTQNQMIPNLTENYVPLSTIQTWYERFERRLQQNTYFWKK